MALGEPVQGGFSRQYCGLGDLARCKFILWFSLQATIGRLESEFSSPNVADWQRQVADEDIRHTAVGVTGVPAIHWINRPTFQQVVQINGPQVVASANGAGSLSGPGGKKIGFSLNVEAYANGGGQGTFQLNDTANHQKVDLHDITSARVPAGPACGSIPAGAAHTFEFTGTGKFNGVSGRTVHVCVQDDGDPGKGLDKLHVDCATCPYNTSSPYTNELLYSGNIDVNSPPPPEAPPGAPSVVSLDPVLGALTGVPQVLTATVYDSAGQPVPNAPVSLSGVTLLPLNLVTDALGQAVFLVLPTGTPSAVASAGGVQSNPVPIGP
jgi:hypothetical protein